MTKLSSNIDNTFSNITYISRVFLVAISYNKISTVLIGECPADLGIMNNQLTWGWEVGNSLNTGTQKLFL